MAPDERDDEARPAIPADRTMQLDALTDVELRESVSEDDEPADDEAPGSGMAPPPLPRRKRETSRGVYYVIGAVVMVAMAGLGAGLAHLLFGGEPGAAPAPHAPEAAPIAAPAAREPRRVELGEIVIGGSTEEQPAATEPRPTESPAPR